LDPKQANPENHPPLPLAEALLWRLQRTTLALATVPEAQWAGLIGPDPWPGLAVDVVHMEEATNLALAWAENENEPATQVIARGLLLGALSRYRILAWAIDQALEAYRPWYLSLKPMLLALKRVTTLRRLLAEQKG